ncbi:MAG: HIT domain-containing protein [Pseudomonadales bacterium]
MTLLLAISTFLAGLALGARFLSRTKPHTPFHPAATRKSLSKKELAGLFASVLVQKTPSLIPRVIAETDRTLVFEHPRPKHKLHYIFMPKTDIQDLGKLGEEDRESLLDLFSAIVSQINKQKLHNYRVWTNGPGRQDVSYLHFHLGAD